MPCEELAGRAESAGGALDPIARFRNTAPMRPPPAPPDPAALIDHPARAAMLTALADGTAREAAELAELAGLPRRVAVAELALLAAGGLIAVETEGRHRFYSLADAAITTVVEHLTRRAGVPAEPPPPTRRRATATMDFARSCHQHLAGALAVKLAAALIAEGSLRPGGGRKLVVTRAGRARFQEVFGLDPDSLIPGRHGTACRCPDWAAGKWHLGGPLGLWTLLRMEQAGWVTRAPESRAVGLTAAGARALGQYFGLRLAATA
jgi:DNA-binding transcriptional ArsR family regulator